MRTLASSAFKDTLEESGANARGWLRLLGFVATFRQKRRCTSSACAARATSCDADKVQQKKQEEQRDDRAAVVADDSWMKQEDEAPPSTMRKTMRG